MGSETNSGASHAAMLGELQHRVRNTLAMTRMIARRSAELSDNLEEYAAHLDGRLAAIARVQNVIVQNAAAGIDLGLLVTDELAAAHAYQNNRTVVEGEDLRLHLRAAEPLALALHELTTNALKFGALATPAGRLAVTWRIEGTDRTSRLVFDWIETGVTVDAQAPRRTGFGTVVLRDMLAHTLGGETALTVSSGGLRYRLVLPLNDRILHGG